MSEGGQSHYVLSDNDELVNTMVYLPMRLIWGKMLAKKAIRVSTWLKMQMIPEYFTYYDAKILVFGGPQPIGVSFSEIHVPVNEIIAYHVLPPEEVEMDYQPDEPNRKMVQVTGFASVFRFDGLRRMSTMSDLLGCLVTSKEHYSPLYDVTVSYPTVPGMKKVHTPYVLLRKDTIYMSNVGSDVDPNQSG